MKRFLTYFLITSFLIFASCTKPEAPMEQVPAYRFGEAVYVANGFYKGCSGHITDFRHYFTLDTNPRGVFLYSVDANCVSVDGKYSSKMKLEVNEIDLIVDESN